MISIYPTVLQEKRDLNWLVLMNEACIQTVKSRASFVVAQDLMLHHQRLIRRMKQKILLKLSNIEPVLSFFGFVYINQCVHLVYKFKVILWYPVSTINNNYCYLISSAVQCLEKFQDSILKTKIKTKTVAARPRPRPRQ